MDGQEKLNEARKLLESLDPRGPTVGDAMTDCRGPLPYGEEIGMCRPCAEAIWGDK